MFIVLELLAFNTIYAFDAVEAQHANETVVVEANIQFEQVGIVPQVVIAETRTSPRYD